MRESACTKELTVQESTEDLDAILVEIQREGCEVILIREGKNVARIVPIVEGEETNRRRFFIRAERLSDQFGDLSEKELSEKFDRAVSEVRRQRHALKNASDD